MSRPAVKVTSIPGFIRAEAIKTDGITRPTYYVGLVVSVCFGSFLPVHALRKRQKNRLKKKSNKNQETGTNIIKRQEPKKKI